MSHAQQSADTDIYAGTLPRMADDVTPSEVKARRFDAARRGYDRTQVDDYLSFLAEEIERLQGKIEDRKTKELKVGLDDPEALALELGTIGGEVATILEAARAASDGMRKRASADVDEWRTSTQREMLSLTADATEQSQSMRAAAWNEGSSMLSSSIAEAKALVESAKEDALFIRAEAEREAIRLTGDAKRDREELMRRTRLDSEELIESARGESNGMLAAASQQAEQAQERARALEDRRAELLSELESTRASISHLEEEIDSRRQELETPEPVAETQPDSRSHHASDSGSVRIVAPSKAVKLQPVDAEDLVADVVALRTGTPVEPDPDSIIEPESVKTETVAVIAPPVEHEPSAGEELSAVSAPSAADKGLGAEADEIDSLFASLREAKDEPKPDNDTSSLPGEQANERATGDREPASPVQEDDAEPEAGSRKPEAEEEPEAIDEPDATLIPLQNAALKDIKRALVDLQNDALEHLRTEKGWTPAKTFTNKFNTPFSDLAKAITGSKEDGGAAKGFSKDLHAAVSGAISRARESGAGERQVASSVSRIFRMWRADEAERRVADAALELSSKS